MSGLLEALERQYVRLAEHDQVPAFGFSREKISFALVLSPEGRAIELRDLRVKAGQFRRPVLLSTPAAVRRTAGVRANLLWDKSAYALGRSAKSASVAPEHEAFKSLNLSVARAIPTPAFNAFTRFLETWDPADLDALEPPAEFLDSNIVFAFCAEAGYLHDHPHAFALAQEHGRSASPVKMCLVCGNRRPVARLHPVIKGVMGAPGTGAQLVSFNLDSVTSRGKRQGDNGPVCEPCAFRYGAALNRMLEPDAGFRLRAPWGDATVVVWSPAETPDQELAAQGVRNTLAELLDPVRAPKSPPHRAPSSADLAAAWPDAPSKPPVHVLALAPQTGRLLVRHWGAGPAEDLDHHLAQHLADITVHPTPWTSTPSLPALLLRSTTHPDGPTPLDSRLADAVFIATLQGSAYPRAWLSACLRSLRKGEDEGFGWRVAALRAVLTRDARRTSADAAAPIALAPSADNAAYLLGRLFALIESAQRRAIGRTDLRRRFVAAACSRPALVFPTLLNMGRIHLSVLARRRRGERLRAVTTDVVARLPETLPSSQGEDDQARFFLGYYHQKAANIAATRPPSGAPAEQAP